MDNHKAGNLDVSTYHVFSPRMPFGKLGVFVDISGPHFFWDFGTPFLLPRRGKTSWYFESIVGDYFSNSEQPWLASKFFLNIALNRSSNVRTFPIIDFSWQSFVMVFGNDFYYFWESREQFSNVSWFLPWNCFGKKRCLVSSTILNSWSGRFFLFYLVGFHFCIETVFVVLLKKH